MRVESSSNYTIIEGSNKQKILEKYLNNGSNNKEVALIDDIAEISSMGAHRDKADKYKNFLANFEQKFDDNYDYRAGIDTLSNILKKS